MIVRTTSASDWRNEDGFTLIEVLVSLVLLALVLGLLSGVVGFARGTWEASARLDRESGYDVAGNFLRARLGEAIPMFEPTEAGAVRVAFKGTGESLSFVAASPNGPAGAGLYRFSLEGSAGAGGRKALLVKVAPYQPRETGDARAETHVLAENVKSVSFRYFGRKERRAAPIWDDAWTRNDAVPDLVEMTISHDDRKTPSVLLVELRLRNRS